MDQGEVEGIAAAVVSLAGVDDAARVSPVQVAKGLGVPVIRGAIIRAGACLATLNGVRTICVRRGAVGNELRWLVAHELGHLALERERYVGEDVERLADAIAAAIIAPRRAVQRARREIGPAFVELGAAFGATPTSAALRWGEVTGEPVAVLAPARPVRVRGDEWGWPPDVARLAKGRVPVGLVRAGLGDRRVALRVA